MSTNFQGKVICITGAASGIGLETVKMLASRGAILAAADLQESALTALVSSLSSTGTQITGTVLDVRDRHAVQSWIQGTVEKYGKLDGAANLAGVIGKNIGIANVQDVEDDEWDFVIGVNLTGVFNCLREQAKVIAEGGSIVNAASVAGVLGLPRNSPYVASKHAVVGLTRAVAKELGPRNVRVNAIAPGPIDTPMIQKSKDTAPHSLLHHIALGREGKPSEVAELICWLLCDGSSYMTGTIQSVDGGWAC